MKTAKCIFVVKSYPGSLCIRFTGGFYQERFDTPTWDPIRKSDPSSFPVFPAAR